MPHCHPAGPNAEVEPNPVAAASARFILRHSRPQCHPERSPARIWFSPRCLRGAGRSRGISLQLRQSGCVRSTGALLQPRRSRDPQSDRRVNSGDPIIRHDSPAAPQRFGLPRRKRLPDIEHTKKYKTQQQIFPVMQPMAEKKPVSDEIGVVRNNFGQQGWSESQEVGQMLSRDFVYHDTLRIFLLPEPGGAGCAPDTECGYQNCHRNLR